MELNVTNKPEPSSVLDFGTHIDEYPDILVVEKCELSS
jgi:hypothetical protein